MLELLTISFISSIVSVVPFWLRRLSVSPFVSQPVVSQVPPPDNLALIPTGSDAELVNFTLTYGATLPNEMVEFLQKFILYFNQTGNNLNWNQNNLLSDELLNYLNSNPYLFRELNHLTQAIFGQPESSFLTLTTSEQFGILEQYFRSFYQLQSENFSFQQMQIFTVPTSLNNNIATGNPGNPGGGIDPSSYFIILFICYCFMFLGYYYFFKKSNETKSDENNQPQILK